MLAAGEATRCSSRSSCACSSRRGDRAAGGRWRAAGELWPASTPPTIQALIAARLDRLATGERAVIECAAVIGKSFWPSAVRELAPSGVRGRRREPSRGARPQQLLAAAVGARFAGEEGLAFSHIVVRDVAYQAMLKAVRADLHARTATWLEETEGERAVEYEEILGYHLEQAHRYLEVDPGDQRTADVAVRAAARLVLGGRPRWRATTCPRLVSLLERASSLLAEDDPTRRDLALKLGIALAGSGQPTRVNTLLSERLAFRARQPLVRRLPRADGAPADGVPRRRDELRERGPPP